MDLVLVNPDSSTKAYQGLAKTYSAIEPPTWALLLAECCRTEGFEVCLIDCDAERLTLDESVRRIVETKARLVLFVVYGQNPNSGTTSMIGALALAEALKNADIAQPICFVGSHVSALPREVLAYPSVDIVLTNEGVYALLNLLRSNLTTDLFHIRGIGYKRTNSDGSVSPILNSPERIVPQECLDEVLPGYAWDLLPFRNRPLDLYRAHFWHADFDHEQRTPFAAIYTALGCQFGCDFCMVNILNRTSNSESSSAADFRGMRYWSTNWVVRQMNKLAELGVRTLRISDEMFFLNRRHYVPLLERIISNDYRFNMWAYSRIDTIRPEVLANFRHAGFKWLALGIEAGNQVVRQEVSKGSFQDINIRRVRTLIGEADISVIGNYIFGFPDDTLATMQETLELAMELNTEMANMYPCQALPGSPMYHLAIRNGWSLPKSLDGYAFLSYECQPLPTKHLSSQQVLAFRDHAWLSYFTNPAYLELVSRKFGAQQRHNVEAMAAIPLRRRILGS